MTKVTQQVLSLVLVCALTMGKGAGESALNWFSGSLLPLTLVCYVSLGKSLPHSEPQFPHLSLLV